MKQKLCAALLCGALMLGLMTTAMAAPVYNTDPAQIKNYMSGVDYYVDEDGDLSRKYDDFTENWLATHPGALERNFGGGRYRAAFMSGFSEGLALTLLTKPTGEDGIVDYRTGDGLWVFMNLNGDILNLDPPRFDPFGNLMEPNEFNDPIWTSMPATVFKDGIAWAEWRSHPDSYVYIQHQGFVNAAGQRVLNIPHSRGFFGCDLSEILGKPFTTELYPRFVNGYTIIANGVNAMLNGGIWEIFWNESPGGKNSEQWFSEYAPEGSMYFDENNLPHGLTSTYSVIDEKGRVVETIHGLDALEKHPLTQVALITSDGTPYGYLKALAQGGRPAAGTGSEQPLVLPTPQSTYGQSTFKSIGYTLVGNVGYLNIEVTNPSDAYDTGDLFYVLYNKYKPGYRDNTSDFLPGDFIRQIRYDLAPGETKVLRVGVGQVGDIGRELTQEELDYGWSNNEAIAASRYILTQAETVEERGDLMFFFKNFHFFGEMELSFQPDANGVTILAAPGGSIQERDGLDEKLAAFTSQF